MVVIKQKNMGFEVDLMWDCKGTGIYLDKFWYFEGCQLMLNNKG